MKKNAQKMTLHKETLRLLDDPSLVRVEGGATEVRTACSSCPPSACRLTACNC